MIKYWIGPAGGDFNSDLYWSTSTGGANDTTHPLVTDDVIFDGGGDTNCTAASAWAAASISCVSGYTHKFYDNGMAGTCNGDITNNNVSVIQIDGTLDLYGSLVNSGTTEDKIAYGAGTINFRGTGKLYGVPSGSTGNANFYGTYTTTSVHSTKILYWVMNKKLMVKAGGSLTNSYAASVVIDYLSTIEVEVGGSLIATCLEFCEGNGTNKTALFTGTLLKGTLTLGSVKLHPGNFSGSPISWGTGWTIGTFDIDYNSGTVAGSPVYVMSGNVAVTTVFMCPYYGIYTLDFATNNATLSVSGIQWLGMQPGSGVVVTMGSGSLTCTSNSAHTFVTRVGGSSSGATFALNKGTAQFITGGSGALSITESHVWNAASFALGKSHTYTAGTVHTFNGDITSNGVIGTAGGTQQSSTTSPVSFIANAGSSLAGFTLSHIDASGGNVVKAYTTIVSIDGGGNSGVTFTLPSVTGPVGIQ